MLDFDRSEIRAALSGKPSLLSTAFSIACAQRLLNSLGDPGDDESPVSIARGFLDALKRHLIDGTMLPTGLEDRIISMIPDEDDEPDFAAGVLDDALAALSFAVRAVAVSPIDSACDAAARALDTAFRYSAQTLNETAFTDSSIRHIMEGPIIQLELERQRRDFGEIARESSPTQAQIQRLLVSTADEAVLPTGPDHLPY